LKGIGIEKGVIQYGCILLVATLWQLFPGEGILPHMGEVIAHFRRKRGYDTQLKFAIAADVTLRTVQEWETSIMVHDHNRRIFLAKLLRIPPALLGLDWRLVVYQDNTGEHTKPSEQLTELVEEDAYYHYEDTLIMAWEWFYSGRLLEIADRFERRLRKLENIVQYVPEQDKEAWKWLLCQYLNLFTQIIQHREMRKESKRQALRVNAGALKLANDIEDRELLALLLHARASIHDEQRHPVQAKVAALAALKHVNNVRTPLSGNMYLLASGILAPYAAHDLKLEQEIRAWQDKALNMVYKKSKIEPDNSFLKLNLAGVHHERARLFLQLHQFHPHRGFLADARNEIKLAWQAFTPDIAEWGMYFHLTEAQIFQAEKDLEGSAKKGIVALQVAKDMRSRKREAQIQSLYYDLMKIDASNPYIHHLGAELGIF
jgi:transcriptional regulator with XRE-family HTH domain